MLRFSFLFKGEYMHDEIGEYLKYLSTFAVVNKPKMPKFDFNAYTDSEYLLAIDDIIQCFNSFDDEHLTIAHLKGD